MNNYISYIVASGIISFLGYAQFLDPLRDVPGPVLARWSRLWMVYHSWKGDMHTTMIALHKKHGKLVRTAPNEVSIADPASIKTIYGAGTKFRKSDWYSVWQGHRKFDLFAERDEKIHGSQRRLVSRIYSMDSLKKLEPSVDNALEVLLEKLATQGSRPINIGLWAQLFAFDVIGEVTFSKPFGFLDRGQDDGSFDQIDAALKSAAWIGQVPWLYWLHDRLIPLIGNWLGVNARHGSLRAFAAKEVEQRQGTGDHQDILELLQAAQRNKPTDMNDMAVLSMATSNIFAGSDTTAISIGAVLYHLCKNPHSMKKLKDELDTMSNEAGSETRPLPLAVANKMPYLQACIYEALRLHPAVGMSLPRTSPQGGIDIDGTYIPGGAVVGTNPWVIHRNTDVFGKDADAFKPERWLGEGRGQLERFFFAFGSGARMCLGRNLSWIEISKLVPSLLHRWDLELVDADAAPKQKCWWFVKHEELYMTLQPRHPAAVES
ncbi:cytochrome P450 [Lentithecium fluviatile CBS 122367]|uniref:Cytochrome P450 n=1 Tax=Lentithecium fluviatile CBS 122367 TaxID=1168545 RepID=A0A6G1IN81_9PLEO|nr:cytochrome P450 [Lentithecium fluviatile CBS 122367]